MVDYMDAAILGFCMGIGSNLSQYLINKHIVKRIERFEDEYKRIMKEIGKNGQV